ncbi:MAG: hypothetical protein EOM53_01280 [Alphaproteobacteria bacterium]|nr:hypothetical protein [Alphaproteobacteria bacterium]NCB49299.1 hypothetical protein [Alphaproteobacteria bacterium]
MNNLPIKYNMKWLLIVYPFAISLILDALPVYNLAFLSLFFGINAFLILLDWGILRKQDKAPCFIWAILGFALPFLYIFARPKESRYGGFNVWLSLLSCFLAIFLSVHIESASTPMPPQKLELINPALLEDQQFLKEKIVEALEGLELDDGVILQDALLLMAGGDLNRVKWSVEGNFYVAFIEKAENVGVLVFEKNEKGIFLVEVILNEKLCATTDIVEQLQCFLQIEQAK